MDKKKKKNPYKDFAKMTAEFGTNWNTIKKNTYIYFFS